jgi:hypothetical protein
MAENKSRLAEIYKAEKSKGGGISSTLGKRALEKMDPRQFFNQKGFMAAALPSLFKSYSATPAKSGEKIASLGGSFSSGVLETKMDILTGETRELKIHSKISAKNSESLPIIARDMNVMRQNITKLVKLQGGTAASRADRFFMKSGERESAYENRFIKEGGKSKTPTQVDAKPKEEKKGIFATIMEGLSSIFSMKGALIAGILAVLTLGIKEYFSNDEFKGKVDALVSDMFSTIKGFLIEYWKEVAIGLALLFPSATMALISSGISILSNGITLLSKAVTTLAPLLADGLTLAFRGLVTLLSGPAGLILLLGGALFAARKLFDQNQEEYLKLAKEKKEKGSLSEKDEARLKELNSPTNEAAAEKQLGYNPITGKVVTQQEANRSMDQRQKDNSVPDKQLKDAAALQLREQWEAGGKKDPKLDPNNNENIERKFQELKKQRSAPNESGAETARLAGKATPVTPTPAAPSTTPTATPSSTASSSGQSSGSSLLDIIAGGESGSMGYDAANKGKAGDMPGGYPGLSQMTVNDVMRLQSEGKVFATGRYQIIPKTLAGLMSGAYGDTGVKGSDLYDASTQDKLVTALINKRLKQGGSDPIQQQFALSQEFASIANPYTGSSYYDKVGNNKASIGTQTIQAALTGTGAPPSTVVASANPSTPASTPGKSSSSLMPTMPNFGDMLMGATADFSDTMRMIEGLVNNVTNITNNSTQASAGGGQQSQGNLPSVYDDVFLNLFQRVT